MSKSYTICVCL